MAGGLSDGGVFSGANGIDVFTKAGTTERLREAGMRDDSALRPGNDGEWTDTQDPWSEQSKRKR